MELLQTQPTAARKPDHTSAREPILLAVRGPVELLKGRHNKEPASSRGPCLAGPASASCMFCFYEDWRLAQS
jgi:hypothetical protein